MKQCNNCSANCSGYPKEKLMSNLNCPSVIRPDNKVRFIDCISRIRISSKCQTENPNLIKWFLAYN